MWLKTLIRSRVLLKTTQSPPIYHYISEMVEDRWVHAARRLISIEFSFDPCNVYRDGPRGVGYPADARSVGGSHPSCFLDLCTSRHTVNSFTTYVHLFVAMNNKSFNEKYIITLLNAHTLLQNVWLLN